MSSLLLLLLLMLSGTTWAQQQHPSLTYFSEDDVKELGLKLVSNSATIDIVWYNIDGATVYNIEWSEEVSEAGGNYSVSDAEFYVIKKLLPCTHYLVSVQAMQDKVHLEIGSDTTRTQAQSSFPVTNLEVAQVDGDATLEVTWAPVTPPGNCELTYRVTWSSSNTSEAGQTTTTEPHYTITNLTYNIEYNVCAVPWVEGVSAAQKCEKETTVTSAAQVNVSLIVGVVLGGVVLVALIMAVVVKWRKREEREDDDSPEDLSEFVFELTGIRPGISSRPHPQTR